MVELTQQHGSPPYSQSRAMEELLAHQTRNNNLTAAAETIKAGNSLDKREKYESPVVNKQTVSAILLNTKCTLDQLGTVAS